MEIVNINATNVRNSSWFKYKLKKNIQYSAHVFDCLFNNSNVLVTIRTLFILFYIRHAADLNDPFFSVKLIIALIAVNQWKERCHAHAAPAICHLLELSHNHHQTQSLSSDPPQPQQSSSKG